MVVPPHVRAHIEAHLAEHVGQGPEALLFPASRGGCHLDDNEPLHCCIELDEKVRMFTYTL